MTTDLRLAVSQNVYGDAPVKIPCLNPLHKDDTASLCVYRENLHCFGCGFHERNIDKALALLLGVTPAEAREIAPKLQARTATIQQASTIDVRQHPLPSGLADLYYANLYKTRAHRLEWLYERGLTDNGIRLGRLGHTGASFVLPVFDATGALLTLRFRRDDLFSGQGDGATAGPKYFGTKGRNGVFLYGEWLLANDKRDWCIITEGELDCLRVWQSGYPACSATNGAGQAHLVPALLRKLLPTIRTVLVGVDTDAAGEAAAKRTCEAARKLGLRVIRLSWLDDAKDLTEYLTQGGTMKGCIRREYCQFDSTRWEQSAAAQAVQPPEGKRPAA